MKRHANRSSPLEADTIGMIRDAIQGCSRRATTKSRKEASSGGKSSTAKCINIVLEARWASSLLYDDSMNSRSSGKTRKKKKESILFVSSQRYNIVLRIQVQPRRLFVRLYCYGVSASDQTFSLYVTRQTRDRHRSILPVPEH